MNLNRTLVILSSAVLILLFFQPVFSQNLPKKIRGYKVYNAQVIVSSKTGMYFPVVHEASVDIGKPEVADISLTGITIEVPAEIYASHQSGKVHFLTFQDFRINGLTVDIEEYREPFSFKEDQATALPKPARIFLRADRILKAAWKEMTESADEWLVTGRVFVFGKFKKMGVSFKRVVPVDVVVKIKNPLIDYKKKITG
jgi:hypothetical protein